MNSRRATAAAELDGAVETSSSCGGGTPTALTQDRWSRATDVKIIEAGDVARL
jgi:hypothetical protein